MMKEIRYIPPIEAPGERQMAVDEAIFRTQEESDIPTTLRFYRFKPSTISVGFSQDLHEVIDTERCEELEIPYVRRITGGGTVFHDYEGEITYSIITEKPEGEIEESFRHLLQPIIHTLEDYDLDVKFKPYNDILVNGKKISGSAQRRGEKALLQHGTIMYATDIDTLADILLLDEDKLKEKGAECFSDLVTTLEENLSYKPDPDRLIEKMKERYSEEFEAELYEGELREEEKDRASLLEGRYTSQEWTEERNWEEK